MSPPSLLIIGCGQLGERVGMTLFRQGWRIGAVRRNPRATHSDFEWFAADASRAGSLDFAAAWRPSYVLVTPTPASMDTAGYMTGFSDTASNLLQGLGDHQANALLMVSSTRVYAEAAGNWVAEESAFSESDPRALAIIDAEQKFLESRHPATIVRCGGIYGGSSSRLLDRIRRGDITPADPVRYTNRIHRDDAAGFLVHLLGMANSGEPLAGKYNCVDDLPAPAHEVDVWLANKMGIPATQEKSGPRAVSQSHKRCSNQLLHATGYTLRYKDYREGYGAILESGKT